jgi:hypothetical protein
MRSFRRRGAMRTNRLASPRHLMLALLPSDLLFLGGCAVSVTQVPLSHNPLARIEQKQTGNILKDFASGGFARAIRRGR